MKGAMSWKRGSERESEYNICAAMKMGRNKSKFGRKPQSILVQAKKAKKKRNFWGWR